MSLKKQVAKLASETAKATIQAYLLSSTSSSTMSGAQMGTVVGYSGGNLIVNMPDGSQQTVQSLGTRPIGIGDNTVVTGGIAL